jgi:hypothetical protein
MSKKIDAYPLFSKSAKPEILFSAFCGGAERIIRNEGRVGLAPLNGLYLCRGKLNRGKERIKRGQAIEKVFFLSLPFFILKPYFKKWDVFLSIITSFLFFGFNY